MANEASNKPVVNAATAVMAKQELRVIFEIEEAKLIENTKRADGSKYYTQMAFKHEVEADGSPSRYPRKCFVFPPRVAGQSVPYATGVYAMVPQSIEVDDRGFPKLGFVRLVPIMAPF